MLLLKRLKRAVEGGVFFRVERLALRRQTKHGRLPALQLLRGQGNGHGVMQSGIFTEQNNRQVILPDELVQNCGVARLSRIEIEHAPFAPPQTSDAVGSRWQPPTPARDSAT